LDLLPPPTHPPPPFLPLHAAPPATPAVPAARRTNPSRAAFPAETPTGAGSPCGGLAYRNYPEASRPLMLLLADFPESCRIIWVILRVQTLHLARSMMTCGGGLRAVAKTLSASPLGTVSRSGGLAALAVASFLLSAGRGVDLPRRIQRSAVIVTQSRRSRETLAGVRPIVLQGPPTESKTLLQQGLGVLWQGPGSLSESLRNRPD